MRLLVVFLQLAILMGTSGMGHCQDINDESDPVVRDLMRYGYDETTSRRVALFIARPGDMEPSPSRDEIRGIILRLDTQITRRGSYSFQTVSTLRDLRRRNGQYFPDEVREDRPVRPPRRGTPVTRPPVVSHPPLDDAPRYSNGGFLSDRQRLRLSDDRVRGVRIGEGGLRASRDRTRNEFVARNGGLRYSELAYRYQRGDEVIWRHQAYTPQAGMWETEANNREHMRLTAVYTRDHTRNGRFVETETRYNDRGRVVYRGSGTGITRGVPPFSGDDPNRDTFLPVRTNPRPVPGIRPRGVTLADATGGRAPSTRPPPRATRVSSGAGPVKTSVSSHSTT